MRAASARIAALGTAWIAVALCGARPNAEVAASVSPPAIREASALGPTEYELKAAFLYHFVVYTEWPADAFAKEDSPLVVAVLGADPFGNALELAFESKSKGKHRIELRRHRALPEVQACHLLFVARSEERRLTDVLRAPIGEHCLVVGDSAGLAGHGAMLGFFLDDSKVRFEADPAAAERAGLSISSKLLKLAKVIEKETER